MLCIGFFETSAESKNATQKKRSRDVLGQPAIHDVLADYIGPKHNLHIVNTNLRNIYGSPFFKPKVITKVTKDMLCFRRM